jgi:hypothetical protein
MIALDTRRLAGASPLYDETLHSALRKVHRQAQAHRAATDDQHLSLARFAHLRSVHHPASRVQNAAARFWVWYDIVVLEYRDGDS